MTGFKRVGLLMLVVLMVLMVFGGVAQAGPFGYWELSNTQSYTTLFTTSYAADWMGSGRPISVCGTSICTTRAGLGIVSVGNIIPYPFTYQDFVIDPITGDGVWKTFTYTRYRTTFKMFSLVCPIKTQPILKWNMKINTHMTGIGAKNVIIKQILPVQALWR